MPGWSSKLRSIPYGTLVLLVIAAGLYVALLANSAPPTGGGEERISQAYAGFFLTLWLWIALALLLVVGGVMGRMPGWAAITAALLHPVSGVAAFVALDAVSRNVSGAILFVALLPLLLAGYAVWARLPQLHEAYPPKTVSLAVWGAVALLTMGGFATGL
ncbi:MAG TPA: hypothetical protein VGH40_08325 [Roseiarcus sp.]|jgi:hypothetical protein